MNTGTTDIIQGRVGLFVPCCIDQLSPRTAWNALHLLEMAGLECHYPTELTCCGMELYQEGDNDGAKALGEKLIDLYEDCTHIVSLSSACVVYFQKHFSRLFHNTTLHNSYRQFVNRCYDFSDFMVNVLHVDDPDSRHKITCAPFGHNVTMLDHCATLRDYRCQNHPEKKGLRDEPRKLLHTVEGLHLVEMKQQDVCCGFGGSFASRFTPISDSLARRKADNAIAAGADIITSTESRCLLHLQSFCDKNNLPLKCMHIADVLCSSL